MKKEENQEDSIYKRILSKEELEELDVLKGQHFDMILKETYEGILSELHEKIKNYKKFQIREMYNSYIKEQYIKNSNYDIKEVDKTIFVLQSFIDLFKELSLKIYKYDLNNI